MKSLLKRLGNLIGRLDYAVQPLLFVAMLVVLALQILYRFVPNLTFAWTLELITFLFGASIWMGVSIAIREEAHVGITIVLERMPPKLRLATLYLKLFLFALFLILLGIYGSQQLINYMMKGHRTPALQAPSYIVRSPLFFGVVFSLYRLVQKAIELYRTKGEDDRYADYE